MATRRLLVFLTGALSIGIGAGWMASDVRPVSAVDQSCLLGVAYAVDVQEDQATFDLALDPGTTYRVILSSLASSDVESQLTLSAEPIAGIERFPLRAVSRIQSAHPRTVHTSWTPHHHPPTISKHSANIQAVSGETRDSRTFFLHVTDGALNDPRQYAKVTAHLAAEGEQVRVFLDGQCPPAHLSKDLVPEIVRLLDDEILPQSRRVLGTFTDVDGDGKFSILISPWLSRLQGGRTSLGGFVRGSDFQQSVAAPFGNQADVMYLNANLRPGPHLKTLLAHEFAHVICFSQRLPSPRNPNGLPTEEDWLNEAIAHLAENLHETGWTNLDHRISQFLDATHRSPLVVPNYYANGLWRDPGCRGATYLFLRWVVDQFGPQVLVKLIDAPNRGVENLETATGVSFADLFRGWTIALARSPQPTTDGPISFLDLGGRIGRWSLQGTQGTPWKVTQGTQSFSLLGTTARIWDISADEAGMYRFRVRSQGQPKLQVTVIRQPELSPSPDVIASWETPASRQLDDAQQLVIRFRIPEGGYWSLYRLAVECQQGKHAQSECWDGELTRQELSLRVPARLFPPTIAATGSYQLKLLWRDSQGRRLAQWIRLPPPFADREAIPVAVKPANPLY